MSEFISKLGIDWKLLLTQSVNFLLLLVILRIFAYKPIIELLKRRRAKIEEGLAKANEADQRLREANDAKNIKMKEAEEEAIRMMRQMEEKAKKAEAEMLAAARKKEDEMMKNAEILAAAKREEIGKAMEKEAVRLVKDAIVKTVELAPEAIDEALVKKAVEGIRKS